MYIVALGILNSLDNSITPGALGVNALDSKLAFIAAENFVTFLILNSSASHDLNYVRGDNFPETGGEWRCAFNGRNKRVIRTFMIIDKGYHCLLVTVGLLALSIQASQAGTMGDIVLQSHATYLPLATFTIGPDFVQKGQAQTLSLLPPFQNHYTNTNGTSTVADVGGFVGVERFFSDKLGVQLGVSGYVNTQISPQGHVWLFASPEFDTLSYAYNIHHTRVMAEGKFLTSISAYQSIHPYVSWGLGAAFNQAQNYQETPLIAGAVPTPPFTNDTQTSFTWGVGAGFDYILSAHTRLGIGYQFTDLGSVSLGPTPAATTNQTLSFSHLYTNQLRFQFTLLV